MNSHAVDDKEGVLREVAAFRFAHCLRLPPPVDGCVGRVLTDSSLNRCMILGPPIRTVYVL